MSSVCIFSSLSYTTGIANSLWGGDFNCVECSSREKFEANLKKDNYDLMILDAESEHSIKSLAEIVRKSEMNKNVGILYLVPGKITYNFLFEGMENAPIIGLSKPFSRSELSNICNVLIKNKQQNDRMYKSLKEVELFAVMTSHDLKTPLKNIFSLSDLLINFSRESDLEMGEFEELSHDINSECEKMLKFVEDVYELSRAGKVKVTYESVNVLNIVHECISKIKDKYPKINLSLEVEPYKELIRTDSVKLAHIFQNLFENAFKYTENENLNIHIKLIDLQGNQLLIDVRDNGGGLKNIQPRDLFEPFKRGAMDHAGSGVGLAVVKKLVNSLGGQIDVETIDGVGTRFYFTLNKGDKNAII